LRHGDFAADDSDHRVGDRNSAHSWSQIWSAKEHVALGQIGSHHSSKLLDERRHSRMV